MKQRHVPVPPNRWDISWLCQDKLATVIPTCTYGGSGSIERPSDTLFLWRSVATETAKGGVLAFYLDDWRLESLWKRPSEYARQFREAGVKALVEVDFSLWADTPVAEQVEAVRRTRVVSRVFQSFDLAVIPNLSWSTEESFPFCFQGIPSGCPVAAVEARTAGQNDEDRRRFIAGLTEGIRQVQPKNVLVYGGSAHKFWLDGNLPPGPVYHLLDSWTDARGKIRKAQEQEVRDRHQPSLFSGGTETWADVDRQAVA